MFIKSFFLGKRKRTETSPPPVNSAVNVTSSAEKQNKDKSKANGLLLSLHRPVHRKTIHEPKEQVHICLVWYFLKIYAKLLLNFFLLCLFYCLRLQAFEETPNSCQSLPVGAPDGQFHWCWGQQHQQWQQWSRRRGGRRPSEQWQRGLCLQARDCS